jgi:nitroimidazol reductase NimA-like FMN-containing flavoprotein (pyridoxamine 5'-phosphate oxidase superfamily)/ribosomal protein S18 acetylase RimI-like enzyme
VRKRIYEMDRRRAVALLARAPAVHVASTAGDGRPVLRTVHGVIVGDAIAFHGAPAGEKMEIVGRPAVIAAEETVAEIPSYFVDPERACPATTYYLSAQVHGVIEAVEAPSEKAAVLAALMARFQPQGGYAPIDADSPLYAREVAGIGIFRMSLENTVGKGKLGQNRRPRELAAILNRLWQRGDPGDPRAIDLVRTANPDVPTPAFLAAPPGTTLRCALGEADVAEAVALLDGAYWNEGIGRDEIARALRTSNAWVGARDESGALIATARAVSDRSKLAWIFDVIVSPVWRGRGLGREIVRLILDHPAVRAARRVRLATRDAQALYRRFGFSDGETLPYPEMMLERVGNSST